MARGRILLAEDDDSMRRFLAAALEKAGYDVDPVDDGLEALEALQAIDYDLLLADIVMPGLDGIDLARRATTMKPALQVMFITGFAAIAVSRHAEMPRHSGLLSKPFHLKELVSQVDAVIGGF